MAQLLVAAFSLVAPWALLEISTFAELRPLATAKVSNHQHILRNFLPSFPYAASFPFIFPFFLAHQTGENMWENTTGKYTSLNYYIFFCIKKFPIKVFLSTILWLPESPFFSKPIVNVGFISYHGWFETKHLLRMK